MRLHKVGTIRHRIRGTSSRVWLSAHAFNSIVQIIENISAARATNSMDLRGVKRRVRSEDLPTSHTQFCTRRTAPLFTPTASKSQLFLVGMTPTKPFGN